MTWVLNLELIDKPLPHETSEIIWKVAYMHNLGMVSPATLRIRAEEVMRSSRLWILFWIYCWTGEEGRITLGFSI